MSDIRALIEKEGWEIVKGEDGTPKIKAFGEEFQVRHPAVIHLRQYRKEANPDTKYVHMKAAHDYLWPRTEWHYWTEDRFREHCNGWNYISMAAGASASKSHDAAKIACLFWLSNPKKRGVVIASTTLDSLGARIWGYAMKFLSKMEVKLPFQYLGGNAPKIVYPTERTGGDIRDTIHGMFAVAAKGGDAEKSISSWIGRHPDDSMLLILDEATDINAAVINSFANLDTGGKPFQCWAIGNSNSVNDLHGAMSTPKIGWDKIDPLTDKKWETTRKNGICLFYSCYESPAIHEKDPDKKKRLAIFLITDETIKAKKIELGEDSDAFYRFVLGFWRLQSTESTVVSKQFLDGFGVDKKTEWSGFYPLQIVGGLDTAFSTGGDQCILKMPILGYDSDGLLVLDFMNDRQTHVIPILRSVNKSAEIQIGETVTALLKANRCKLSDVAIDATGQGRALGGVLQLLDDGHRNPIRIYSTKMGNITEDAFDVVIKSSYDLWYTVRQFVANGQIRGLNNKTILQLSNRQVEYGKKGQPSLESKLNYKRRMGAQNPAMAHSPDDADTVALAVQAAIINYGFALGKRREFPKIENFEQMKLMVHRAEQKQTDVAIKKKNTVLRVNFLKGIESVKRKSF